MRYDMSAWNRLHEAQQTVEKETALLKEFVTKYFRLDEETPKLTIKRIGVFADKDNHYAKTVAVYVADPEGKELRLVVEAAKLEM